MNNSRFVMKYSEFSSFLLLLNVLSCNDIVEYDNTFSECSFGPKKKHKKKKNKEKKDKNEDEKLENETNKTKKEDIKEAKKEDIKDEDILNMFSLLEETKTKDEDIKKEDIKEENEISLVAEEENDDALIEQEWKENNDEMKDNVNSIFDYFSRLFGKYKRVNKDRIKRNNDSGVITVDNNFGFSKEVKSNAYMIGEFDDKQRVFSGIGRKRSKYNLMEVGRFSKGKLDGWGVTKIGNQVLHCGKYSQGEKYGLGVEIRDEVKGNNKVKSWKIGLWVENKFIQGLVYSNTDGNESLKSHDHDSDSLEDGLLCNLLRGQSEFESPIGNLKYVLNKNLLYVSYEDYCLVVSLDHHENTIIPFRAVVTKKNKRIVDFNINLNTSHDYDVYNPYDTLNEWFIEYDEESPIESIKFSKDENGICKGKGLSWSFNRCLFGFGKFDIKSDDKTYPLARFLDPAEENSNYYNKKDDTFKIYTSYKYEEEKEFYIVHNYHLASVEDVSAGNAYLLIYTNGECRLGSMFQTNTMKHETLSLQEKEIGVVTEKIKKGSISIEERDKKIQIDLNKFNPDKDINKKEILQEQILTGDILGKIKPEYSDDTLKHLTVNDQKPSYIKVTFNHEGKPKIEIGYPPSSGIKPIFLTLRDKVSGSGNDSDPTVYEFDLAPVKKMDGKPYRFFGKFKKDKNNGKLSFILHNKIGHLDSSKLKKGL